MMSSISMVEAKLPPGFRFHPRDEELVCDFLMKKLTRSDTLLLIDVDLNKCEPWDIPETACVGGKEWYFYSRRDRKYATGLRTNRATACGYWKATGKDRPILRKGSLVGMRKTLVFYQGRAPKGRKTDWVMHEFRIEAHTAPKLLSSLKEDWVLCRVFYKRRELGAQASMGMGIGYSNYDDNDTGSSSLPPLMDSYISFDQTQPNLDEYNKQVSCFSIFSQDQTNPAFTTHQFEPIQNIPTKNSISSPFDQIFQNLEPSSSCDNNKVIKAVLNHLTKFESKGSPSSESLSEVGMPNMWNNNNHY